MNIDGKLPASGRRSLQMRTTAVPPHSSHFKRQGTVLLLFVVVVIFLWSNGFNLQLFDLSDRFKLLNLFGLFMIVTAAGFSMTLVSWARYFRNYYFWCIAGILAVALFPTFVNLVVVNSLSPVEVLRSGLGYSGLFIFILLISYRTDFSFVVKLNTIIFAMATVNVLFLVVMSVVPGVAESLLVINIRGRFDRIRLVVASGIVPMVQYAFCYALVIGTERVRFATRKALYLLFLVAYFWYFFIVEMGRRTIVVLLIIITYYIVFHLRGRYRLRTVFALFFILSLLFAVPQFNAIQNAIKSTYSSSIEEYQLREGNVGIRLEGINYYLNLFKESGYLGIGLPSNRVQQSDPYIQGTEWYRFNPNDHGIFTVLYSFGFPGIVLTIVFLFHLFGDLTIIRRRGPPEHQAIAMAIHLYLVFSIVALLQIFWKPSISLWTGLMFFMVWRMRVGIEVEHRAITQEQGSSTRRSSK